MLKLTTYQFLVFATASVLKSRRISDSTRTKQITLVNFECERSFLPTKSLVLQMKVSTNPIVTIFCHKR